MNRRERIRALLHSLDEHIPGPKSAKRDSAPGIAPTDVECPNCDGRGTVPDFSFRTSMGFQICRVCNGDGRRPATKTERRAWERDEGDPVLDRYTADYDSAPKKLTDFKTDAERRTMTTREIDDELKRLRSLERARQGIIDEPLSPSERKDLQGSYKALRIAIDGLSRQFGFPWDEERLLDELEPLMPHPVRVPNYLYRKEEIPTDILELAKLGWKKSRIAKATGYSLRAVKNALKAA